MRDCAGTGSVRVCCVLRVTESQIAGVASRAACSTHQPRPPRRSGIAIARAAPSLPPTALLCSALLPPFSPLAPPLQPLRTRPQPTTPKVVPFSRALIASRVCPCQSCPLPLCPG